MFSICGDRKVDHVRACSINCKKIRNAQVCDLADYPVGSRNPCFRANPIYSEVPEEWENVISSTLECLHFWHDAAFTWWLILAVTRVYFITMRYYFNVYEFFVRWIHHSLAKLKCLSKGQDVSGRWFKLVPIPGWGREGGGGVLGLIFAGYVELGYPIIVYSVVNYGPHLSRFWANM